MEKISFKIATPERVVYKDDIDQISIPTQMGEITVLPNHIPLIAILQAGELKIKKGSEITEIAVSGGFVEVLTDKIVILADTAERAEEIDIEKAEAARQRAEEIMKTKQLDATEFARISAQIEKELARIRVGKKYRKIRT